MGCYLLSIRKEIKGKTIYALNNILKRVERHREEVEEEAANSIAIEKNEGGALGDSEAYTSCLSLMDDIEKEVYAEIEAIHEAKRQKQEQAKLADLES